MSQGEDGRCYGLFVMAKCLFRGHCVNAFAWQIWGIELKLIGSTQDPNYTEA